MTDRESNLVRSMTESSWRFFAWIGLLGAIVLCGLYAYAHQLRQGLIVTGLRDQVSWGMYIANFVFFIGISHAGTLISAILRVTDTGWRRPITRMAEAITVFALCIGAPMVIVDLGRPDRILNLLRYGRIQSPILWDVLAVMAYLTGCVLYFYLPLIPDLGALAEQPGLAGWRRRLYRTLSLRWTGSPAQKELLEKAISVMAVVIIPLAVSVHTVVSWIFAMTLRPGWDSSIFGPYFVVGAIFSGAASVILSMFILRRVFHLEAYLEPVHFRNLGFLLLSFAMLYLYFNINEYLTVGYKFQGLERDLLERLFFGDYALFFWGVQTLGVFVPMVLMMAVLGLKRYEPFVIPGVGLASLLVVLGAWAKRYLIVVPTLSSPYLPIQRLPWEWEHYRPTWVEWAITAAAFAGFLLIYSLLSKVFPMVSIWETREGESAEVRPEAPPASAASRPVWGSIPSMGAMLLIALLGGATLGHAGEPRPKAKSRATTLTVEWRPAAPRAAASSSSVGEENSVSLESPRVYFLADRIFGHLGWREHSAGTGRPVPAIAVTAALRDAEGKPVAFQAVGFSLRTSLGALQYGNRPTDQSGQAQLLLHEPRYGKYPAIVTFAGNDDLSPSQAQVLVDFGPRPPPALPSAGVLITPYATPAIGIPFLVFYGIMWVVYAYAFGYLILWQMRRLG